MNQDISALIESSSISSIIDVRKETQYSYKTNTEIKVSKIRKWDNSIALLEYKHIAYHLFSDFFTLLFQTNISGKKGRLIF